ncbi:hypothetical protein L7F22_058473 [Adiantum nelumboides]|nr:hypothetical protein [Adiantum nelumboides]
MASKLSPATPRPKLQRGSNGDGERISPATKTGAASMLGDNSPKATRSPRSFSTEKKTPVSRGAELQQVQEELSRTKEQLALVEKSKSNLLQDLARSKRQLEDLNSKLQDANEISKHDRLRTDEMEHTSFKAVEDWQSELEVMRKQYEAAVLDLQTNKQAMENLKHELFVCIEAKDEAVRLAGEAMNAAESTAKRVEEMSVELLAAKGSSFIADSAPAKVGESTANAFPTPQGLAEITARCDGSTEESTSLLTTKEAERYTSAQEVCHLRSEVESLKQELSLAQKLVREQTAYENSKHEVAAVLAGKEAELQNAIQEASIFQAESESLRRELLVAQQSVIEHGKSMKEASALLAKKDLELQSVIKEASQLRSESDGLRQDFFPEQNSVMDQLDGADAILRLYQSEAAGLKESERNFRAQLLDMTSEVNRLSSELKDAKAAANNLCVQLANVTSELEQLKNELAAANKAKDKALVAESAASADRSKMAAEIANAKECELVALASLSALSTELKEAQENFAKANTEVSMLSGVLESLKADFDKFQLDLSLAEGKKVHATEEVKLLRLELINLTEASQKESKLLKDQVASAQAAMDALKLDAEAQRLELIDIMEKEAVANEKLIEATRSLQNVEMELAELRKQQTSDSKKNIVLAEQLDLNLQEILETKQRELNMSAKVASLLRAFEDKEQEVTEWERKVNDTDRTSTALKLDLENTKAELSELKERETCVSTKATALSVILASLTEKNEARLNELKLREAVLITQVEALNGELIKTKLDLEEALAAAKVARDETDKLQASLLLATLELDHARQVGQKFKAEAAQSKEEVGVALVKLQEAKAEAEKALKEVNKAELEVQEQSQNLQSLILRLQIAQDEGILAKEHIDSLNDKLRATAAELQAHVEEMGQLRQETQASREEAEKLQSGISFEKEQAVLAKDQAEAARQEVEKIKKEIYNMRLKEERTQSIHTTSRDGYQDTLTELQLSRSDACSAQMEASTQTYSTINESVPQEELENLKVKVKQTEEQLALSFKEIENSHANAQIMLKNLETMKLEKEAHEKALLEVHQHLADTEKAKSNLEAEIQRLLDESKQWQTMKDAVGIPIHPETMGRNFASDSRDEKPQPDSPNEESEVLPSPVSKSANGDDEPADRQEKVMKEHIALREDFACLSLRRDDSEKEEFVARDDSSLHDEMASIPTKKKKKTLLVRLGTLLEKKKHTAQHTP